MCNMSISSIHNPISINVLYRNCRLCKKNVTNKLEKTDYYYFIFKN